MVNIYKEGVALVRYDLGLDHPRMTKIANLSSALSDDNFDDFINVQLRLPNNTERIFNV